MQCAYGRQSSVTNDTVQNARREKSGNEVDVETRSRIGNWTDGHVCGVQYGAGIMSPELIRFRCTYYGQRRTNSLL